MAITWTGGCSTLGMMEKGSPFGHQLKKLIMHNDLHAHNILLHFSNTSKEIFFNLYVWGMMTAINTYKHYPPIKDDTLAPK